MNRYTFSDLQIGMTESFSVTVTKEHMDAFRTITGDVNPLHADSSYAKERGFDGQVCFGMLTASFLSTLAGVYLPGEHCLIHSVESKFTGPVLEGDTLQVIGEVSELHESVQQAVLKVRILNARGEKVLKGKMKVGFTHERE